MAENAFTECAKQSTELEPQDLQLQNSVAIAAIMKAMGVDKCTRTDVSLGPLTIVGEGSTSVGCEQIAVYAKTISQVQQAVQCAMTSVSQSSRTSVIGINEILIELTGNARVQCIYAKQNINLKIASTTEFSNEIKASMAADLESAIKNLSTVVQENSKKNTTTGVEGNKFAEAFAEELRQRVFQAAFTEIIEEVIQAFQATNVFTLRVSGNALVGLLDPSPYSKDNGCVVVDQNVTMQVWTQTIMTNVMSYVFNTKLAADWSNEWILQQKSSSEGGSGLIAIIIAIIVLLIVIGLVVYMMKRNNGQNSVMGTGQQAGDTGRTIAIVFLIIGIVMFIIAILLIVFDLTVVGGAVMIPISLAVIAISAFMLYRANLVKAGKSPS